MTFDGFVLTLVAIAYAAIAYASLGWAVFCAWMASQ
jgi:hypothetical protein